MELEPGKTQLIREIVEGLLQKIDSPYIVTPYAQDLHDLCCKFATEHGYPMGIDPSEPSLRPSIPTGVVIASIAYAHIEDEATQIFISLYTAFVTYVDDAYTKDSERVSVFTERFIRREKQLDPVLDSLASFLLSISDYYEPVVGNIILTTALNFINSTILDLKTQGMKVSSDAKHYPEFIRRMTGAADTYALMVFPRTIPVQKYIQCIPEARRYIHYMNDVLSFYKEELAQDTATYLSLIAGSRGISKMKALEQIANNAAEAHERVCKILIADREAYDVWQRFKDGYVGFHTSSKRYRLDGLMNYRGVL